MTRGSLHKGTTTKMEPLGATSTLLNEVEALHRKAMECAEQAVIARANGKTGVAKAQFEEAYQFESRAANKIAGYDVEPTRSVLHRSAATLALDCGRYTEAAKLAWRGLDGLPPDDIEQELKDVLQSVPQSILSSVTESISDASRKFAGVQDILVKYDKRNNGVIVTPRAVNKGATVRFKDPKGTKLRISFLSPMGEETKSLSDSDVCTLKVGGVYHFKCYFTLPGGAHEISPKNVGVIDVSPHLP